MPRKKRNRRGPGSPALRSTSYRPTSPETAIKQTVWNDGKVQQNVSSASHNLDLEQLHEMFKDSVDQELVRMLYADNNSKVEATLDALIAITDSTHPLSQSVANDYIMEYSGSPNSAFLQNLATSRMNDLGLSTRVQDTRNSETCGTKPVGFERSKNTHEYILSPPITPNVPALFDSLPHSDFHSFIRPERLESVDGVPLLTPVELSSFTYPTSTETNQLIHRPLETNRLVDEAMDFPKQEQYSVSPNRLMSSPMNIPKREDFLCEKKRNTSPNSPKIEHNFSKSPTSPKGQPKSPHQPKGNDKTAVKGKKKKVPTATLR